MKAVSEWSLLQLLKQIDYIEHNSTGNFANVYSFMIKIAGVGCITWHTKLSSTSREINILYGFTKKKDSSIWLLSLQILDYIYWNMTYCALSLYLNCILCCFPFSCLVHNLYRLWMIFPIKAFNANEIWFRFSQCQLVTFLFPQRWTFSFSFK